MCWIVQLTSCQKPEASSPYTFHSFTLSSFPSHLLPLSLLTIRWLLFSFSSSFSSPCGTSLESHCEEEDINWMNLNVMYDNR